MCKDESTAVIITGSCCFSSVGNAYFCGPRVSRYRRVDLWAFTRRKELFSHFLSDCTFAHGNENKEECSVIAASTSSYLQNRAYGSVPRNAEASWKLLSNKANHPLSFAFRAHAANEKTTPLLLEPVLSPLKQNLEQISPRSWGDSCCICR